MAGALMIEAYMRAYELERAQIYPMVDAFEARQGYALEREKLETAARTLACPLKKHAPNWQHGRVLYAAARNYCTRIAPEPVTILDIGTAKGFSALCLTWAALDAGLAHRVVSVDVVDPAERVFRNSVREERGPLTVAEYLEPWPEARAIECVQATGRDWLREHDGRVNLAFVDGKHEYSVVKTEADWLTLSQRSGDIVVFDDVHVPGVLAVMRDLMSYELEYLSVLPHRCYAIGRRK